MVENSLQPRLIDTDIHNAMSADDLSPYLPAYWREVVSRRGFGTPQTVTGVPSPVGVGRSDAKPPEGGPPGSDPKFVIEHHLDPYGIDYGVLNGSGILGISLNPNLDYGNAVASAYNDAVARKWLDHDPRYRGSILINHSDPEYAAKEIDRVAKDKRFVQVIMASASNRLFGQRVYHPIFEAAVRNGLPIAIHAGTEGAGTSYPPTPAGYTSTYMEWHNIIPINYMAHINSLVCEGVFEKFPTLKFIAVEGGIAWLPHLMWRMDKNYKALRSTTPWLKRLPSEYIREHIRLTTQPIEEPEDPQHILQILDMVDATHTVMFASDYPHWDFDNPKMALPPLRGEMKQRILAGNASELYGLWEKISSPTTQAGTEQAGADQAMAEQPVEVVAS
jgi:predicted TIM-barrel fold metal-dependent hydrolase